MYTPRPEALEPQRSLREVERGFLGDILGRRRRDEQDRRLAFVTPLASDIESRFAVYYGGYRARLVEAIAETHPATAKILGPTAFAALVERYVLAHPSRSFDLGLAADRWVTFVRGDALANELPFLADLGGLEQAVSDAFVAADDAPLKPDDLATLCDDALLGLRIDVRAGTKVLRSDWPIEALWRLKDGDRDIELDQSAVVLVSRHEERVTVRALDQRQAKLIELVATRRPKLSALADAWPGHPAELGGAFAQLMQLSIFRSLEPEIRIAAGARLLEGDW